MREGCFRSVELNLLNLQLKMEAAILQPLVFIAFIVSVHIAIFPDTVLSSQTRYSTASQQINFCFIIKPNLATFKT